ncbi:HAMP domain-containing sensor histidine kinase [Gottschalkiaceae bacterium SANA]|nr:HAMP domain-containing sensor histidine kinase [Gottschalkiaceae bacterium SANA]
MKLALKIYLFTVLLFLLIFNATGYVNLEESKNAGLRREVERSRNEEATIVYGLWEQIPMISGMGIDLSILNRDLIQGYLKILVETLPEVYVEILDQDGSQVASNFNMEWPKERPELNFSSRDERRTLIRDHGDRSLLFVSSQIQLNGEWFYLTYARDITDFYTMIDHQWRLFFQSEVLALLLFSLFMLLISQSIAKPLKAMVQMTQEMTDGNLERRLPEQNGYEFALLGHHLNQMAASIQDNTIRLEAANREKEAFIESFTHEMKTPLTSVIGYAEYLRNAKTDEETRTEALQVIWEEGRHLERLSMKLMDLILLRKGNFAFENTSMDGLIKEVLQAMVPRFQDKDIHIEADLEPGFWIVEADYFKVLLKNILDNAVKAVEERGQIAVFLHFTNHEMQIRVQDNGIGMAETEIARIVEPFYMVDKARTRKHHGAGLGLSICQRVLEIHQGRFEIKSQLNEGTSVTMIFKEVQR